MTILMIIKIIWPECLAWLEAQSKPMIKTEAPLLIKRLTLAEQNQPGFLHMRAFGEHCLVDIIQVALDWANSDLPVTHPDDLLATKTPIDLSVTKTTNL